jgi:hypothetical protein
MEKSACAADIRQHYILRQKRATENHVGSGIPDQGRERKNMKGPCKIIINGGPPMPGCPKSWEEAHEWEENSNKNKRDDYEPRWHFDCGYKLDFDGPLFHVLSRFYPPKKYYGDTWDGDVEIYFFDEVIAKKSFDEKTLDNLKVAVEKYISNLKAEFIEFWNTRLGEKEWQE